MRKIVCEPGTQVAGATVMSLIENVQAADLSELVKKYGFENVAPNMWYSLEDFLRFLAEMVENPEMTFNSVAIGMSIADTAHMPPGMESPSFTEMVEGWDAHYQANFRNGDVGHKVTVKLSPKHYKVVHNNTKMPDDLEYGVLYGFAKRFLPPGTDFTVWYDEDVIQMDEGGDQTVLHVSWE